MPKTLYLHLGLVKTGTSSLQWFLVQNRQRLLNDFKILYPVPPSLPIHRHQSLFPYDATSWRGVRAQADSSGCKTVVVSCEDLSEQMLPQNDFTKITEIFHGFTVKIVVYVRRMDDICKSWYMQRAKSSKTMAGSFDQYLRSLIATRSPYLWPTKLLRHYKTLVGPENLIIRLYTPGSLVNGSTIDDFFSILNVSLPDSYDRNRRRNPSLPFEALPCITASFDQHDLHDPVKNMLYGKIIDAFSAHSQVSPIPADLLQSLQEEIAGMDSEYLPGYQQLFTDRPLDLSLPKNTISPHEILMLDLLYSIFFELNKKKTRAFNRKRKIMQIWLTVKNKLRTLFPKK